MSTLVAEPVYGWKTGRLRLQSGHLPGTWTVSVKPQVSPVVYGFGETRAVCAEVTATRHVEHDPGEVPHVDCTCGWYARSERRRDMIGCNDVALHVALSGRVVQHDDPSSSGTVFRAEFQRVVGVEFDRDCGSCGDPATFVTYGLFGLRPACAKCTEEWLGFAGSVAFRLNEFADVAGVPCRWANLDEYPEVELSPFAQAGAQLRKAMDAYSMSLQQTVAGLGAIADSLAKMRDGLSGLSVGAEGSRRDGETVLECKRRNDEARRTRLEDLARRGGVL